MKLFKKLAVLCLSLTMCLGIGASFAACGDKDASTSSSVTEPVAYKFQIKKANGDAAVGYRVLLCEGEACGGFATADENGIATYLVSYLPGDKTAKGYDIHVLNPDMDDSTYLTLTSSSLKTTLTSFSETLVTLTLAA